MARGPKDNALGAPGKGIDAATGPGNVTPLRPKRPCPECGRPSARETYPFCSTRCKDIDLNRWLSGAYVIPGGEEEDADGAAGSNAGDETDPS